MQYIFSVYSEQSTIERTKTPARAVACLISYKSVN